MVRAGMVLAGLAGCLLAGCGGAGGMAGESYRLSILHINDHHSHLDPTVASLMLPGSPDGRREAVSVSLGGFARVGQAFDELAEGKANLLKLHAGDAITGTLYFTLTQGRADAQLMNAVCFDAMAVGNHEFDPGDTGLAQFIEALWDNEDDEEGCRTPVLSANVAPREGSPLGERLRPSVVLERGGERIGVVGLTVQRKTQNSSRPDPGTRLLDEQASAQAAIDALRADGVNKVVLLSHVGYPRDRELAAQLSGVDVVVGGDSHSLLGSSALEAIGLKPVGPYPDEVHNKDGDRVCVVQAWQYAYAVGELDVVFDGVGRVRACEGQVHVLIGDVDEVGQGSDAPFGAIPELRVTALSPRVEALLAPHREARAAFGDTVVGEVVQPLCLRRVPGSGAALSHSVLPGCDDDPHVIAHGGDVQQLVAEAFLRQGQRYGGAEVSIQNGGGVRGGLAGRSAHRGWHLHCAALCQHPGAAHPHRSRTARSHRRRVRGRGRRQQWRLSLHRRLALARRPAPAAWPAPERPAGARCAGRLAGAGGLGTLPGDHLRLSCRRAGRLPFACAHRGCAARGHLPCVCRCVFAVCHRKPGAVAAAHPRLQHSVPDRSRPLGHDC